MKQNLSEFFSNYDSKTRKIIDEISKAIFLELPNITEKIIGEKLKYVCANGGTLCTIYYKRGVYIKFKAGKEIKFPNLDSVNKEEISYWLSKSSRPKQ